MTKELNDILNIYGLQTFPSPFLPMLCLLAEVHTPP